MGDQHMGSPLPTQDNTNTEHIKPVFERKRLHVLERSSTEMVMINFESEEPNSCEPGSKYS
jgi:hypothetical protein